VFDLDGVFADSKKEYVETIHDSLTKRGYGFSKKRISYCLGQRMPNTLNNLGIKGKERVEIGKEAHANIAKISPSLKLCLHAKEVLSFFRRDNEIKIAQLTNSTRRYTLRFLNKHKIRKYFHLILGGDQFNTKNDAFKMLFKRFKVEPEETIYIGDRRSDGEIAKAVGCKYILIYKCSWDKAKIKRTSKYVLNDLSKLIKFKKQGFLA